MFNETAKNVWRGIWAILLAAVSIWGLYQGTIPTRYALIVLGVGLAVAMEWQIERLVRMVVDHYTDTSDGGDCNE